MSLALTENAVAAVKEVVASAPEAQESSGMRIVAHEAADGQTSFELSIASVPAEDDEVIEEQGARVFLDSNASDLLESRELDARVDSDRHVAFVIGDQ
jgi:Fe-S cluster assembly iron-binding protein IscA